MTMSRWCSRSSASGGGVAALLDRRLVAPHALRRFLQKGPRDLTAAKACESAAARLRDVFAGVRDGLDVFLGDGPVRHPQFAMLADDVRQLVAVPPPSLVRDPSSFGGAAPAGDLGTW